MIHEDEDTISVQIGSGQPVLICKDPSWLERYEYDGKFCGNCDLCCKSSILVLYGSHDNLDLFEQKVKVMDDPEVWIVGQKKNGDCLYLENGKCSVHKNAPAVCRQFDCRIAYLYYKFTGVKDYSDAIIKKGKLMQRKHPLDMSVFG